MTAQSVTPHKISIPKYTLGEELVSSIIARYRRSALRRRSDNVYSSGVPFMEAERLWQPVSFMESL